VIVLTASLGDKKVIENETPRVSEGIGQGGCGLDQLSRGTTNSDQKKDFNLAAQLIILITHLLQESSDNQIAAVEDCHCLNLLVFSSNINCN